MPSNKRNPGGGAAEAANNYNPNQPRDPAGTKTGGRWTKQEGEAPVIIFEATDQKALKDYFEGERQKWIDASVEELRVSSRDDDNGTYFRAHLGSGIYEDVSTREEAEAIIERERESYEAAEINFDEEEGVATLVVGSEVLSTWRNNSDGQWEDGRGRIVEIGGRNGEVSSVLKARAEGLLGRMPLKDAKVSPISDGFRFRAFTGGREPYEIIGSVQGDSLDIESMLPVDGAQSFSGSSRGAGLLISTVEAAQDHGLKAIRTQGGKSQAMTGFRTWPALGFDVDAEAADQLAKSIPPAVKKLAGDPPSLLALTSTREGRLWWRKNGESLPLRFDLEKNSASTQRLNQVKEMLSR